MSETFSLKGGSEVVSGAVNSAVMLSSAVASAGDLKINLAEMDESRIIGSLSMEYETGRDASQYLLAAGVVSNGKQDTGGISYGAYQLSSSKNQVQRFLQEEGARWAKEFDGLDPTQSGAFGKKWKAIAKTQGEEFFNAQHAYIDRSHYTPVVEYLRKNTGLDISKLPAAVQDVVWSASVQHGHAQYLLMDAINSLRALDSTSARYAPALINAIYDKRSEYVSKLNILNKDALLQNRYPDERRRALNMLKEL